MNYKEKVVKAVTKVAGVAASNTSWWGNYEPKKPKKLEKK